MARANERGQRVSVVGRIERPAPADDVQSAAERRQAARALLRRPFMTDDGSGSAAEELRLVRRHRADLERLFAEALGYRLVVEPRAARLFKAGLGRDGSRALRRGNAAGTPFTPRAYALLCLTVAALTRCKEQLLIDELVAEIRSAIADSGLDIDLDSHVDRRALHAAIVALIDFGVVVERDGDLAGWAADARVQSLLDVRRERLRLLIARPLTNVETPDELLDVAALPSAAGGARVALRRRLLESPVLSLTDMTDDQQEWWSRNRNREREWFRDRFGLELELRAEGAVALDPEEELTDTDFPGPGSARHVALLLLERLVDIARSAALEAPSPSRVWRPLAETDVDAALAAVHAEYSGALRRAYKDDLLALRRDALEVLMSVGLIAESSQGYVVHAAAARYRARTTLADDGPTHERSLFAAAELGSAHVSFDGEG
jgi:uncharacterized protein (TIGR02678 family)